MKPVKVFFSDLEMVEGIRQRDSQALSAIYRLCQTRITAHLRAFGVTDEEAMDLFQEGIVEAYIQVQAVDFQLTGSFYTYLFSICHNRWKMQYSTQKTAERTDRRDVSVTQDFAERQPFIWEQYALGKLTGSDLTDLEARMASDSAFAAEVARVVAPIRAIQLAPEVTSLRAQLADITADIEHRRQSWGTSNPFLLAVAAALLLIGTAVWYLSRTPIMSSDAVFAAHFNPPLMMNATNRELEVVSSDTITLFFKLWEQGEQAYNIGSFQEAIDLFGRMQAMTEGRQHAEDLAFYKGLSFLQCGNGGMACIEFNKIKTSYPAEKTWYMALGRLQYKDTAVAKKELADIANSASPFAAEAGKMLHQLK